MSGLVPTALPGDTIPQLKCACAELWAHPIAQLLAGPTLRPGGRELTGRFVDGLGLCSGARVLDIGSGTGATLAELKRRELNPFGVDYSATLAAQATEQSPVAIGDAEALPFATGSFDALLAECVFSALPDKPTALSEARRVLTPRGAIVLTDMTVSGTFPEPLQSIAAWAACVGGALSADDYEALLGTCGFAPCARENATAALAELVDQAERRLAMLQGAMGVGLIEQAGAPFGTELAQLGLSTSPKELFGLGAALVSQVREAIVRGELGYVAISAVVT